MPRTRFYRTFAQFERDALRIARSPQPSPTTKQELTLGRAKERSRTTKQVLNEPIENQDRATGGPKAALIAAALRPYQQLGADEFGKLSRAHKERYQALRNAAQDEKPKASGSDRRQYNPTGTNFAVNTFGYLAGMINAGPRGFARELPAFLNPVTAIPCIQRSVRRQVMFAKHQAGKGYKTKKRRNHNSGVPC